MCVHIRPSPIKSYRKVDIGSLTCAAISVYSVHMNVIQAETSAHVLTSRNENWFLTLSHLGVEPWPLNLF